MLQYLPKEPHVNTFKNLSQLFFGHPTPYTIFKNSRKLASKYQYTLKKMDKIMDNTNLWYLRDQILEEPEGKVSTMIPDWQKAAKKYGAQAIIEDLQEVKDSKTHLSKSEKTSSLKVRSKRLN